MTRSESTNMLQNMLEIANSVSKAYSSDPRVDAIAIVGSLATGKVDTVSDIDLMIYCSELPTDEERKNELSRARESGGDNYGSDENGFAFWRCVEGCKVDVAFNQLSNVQKMIDEVYSDYSTESDLHLILGGIGASLALHGKEVVEGWKQMIGPLPDPLREKMILENIRVTPFWILERMCVDRNESTWLHELLTNYARKILWITSGINGSLYPGKLKGFEQNVRYMDSIPAELSDRMAQLFSLSAEQIGPVLESVFLDLFDLVEERFPKFDVAKHRDWFCSDVACSP